MPQFLSGGGEMGRRIRDFDWSLTSLNTVTTWPQSLQSALSICLNSNFPIAIYWGKELVLLYNDAWSPIPGNKHPWALGRPAQEVWPDIWDAIEPQFQKAFSGEPGGSKDALLPMQRHGYIEECYFDFTFTPIYGEGGKVEGVFNAVIETTYRIISERRTAFLKNLAISIASAQSIQQLFDEAMRFTSSASEDIPFALLYSYENSEAKLSAASVKATDIAFSSKAFPFDKVANDGASFYVDNLSDHLAKIPQDNWKQIPKEAVIVPLFNSSGLAKGFLVCGLSSRRRFDEEYNLFIEGIANTITNVSNNIVALEEERKRSEALAEIDKAKTTFFSNVSHEFRTPLTLMLGSLEEMLKNPNREANDRQAVETTHRNAIRLLRLVNNLLDFSRIEAGKAKAQYQLTDIAKYTTDLASNFRSVIENAGLSFKVTTDAIIQPVFIDKEMWEKIVLNLLSNAFKYTLEGSIELSLTSESSQVILKVKDTGVGIPKEELPKMFQRFHRVQNVTGRTYEGTGIGLSLVKELVHLHGGQVSVSSAVGKGTEFTVSIPTGKAHLPKENVIAQDSNLIGSLSDAFIEEASSLLEDPYLVKDEEEPQGHEHSPKVLIVDDNADMRTYLKSILQQRYRIITAGNGMEGLHKINEENPSLVISDVMMPIIDGIQMVKELKQNPATANLPIILLSARAGEEAKVEGFDIGADDYLVKPFSAKELLARVESHIRLKQNRDNALRNLYNVFDGVPFAVAVLMGEDLVLEFINQYNLSIWQRSKEEVLGKPLYKVFPGNREAVEAVHRQVYATQQRFVANEIPVEVFTDGKLQTRWFNTVIDPLRNEKGQVIGQLASTIEVTEQVMARKNVEESQRELQSLFKQAPAAIAVVEGPQHKYVMANLLYQQLFDRTEEQLLGKTIREVFPEVGSQGIYKIFEEVYHTGKPYIANEFPAFFDKLGDGVKLLGYYNFVAQPIRNAKGEVTSILIHAFEITEQVEARKKLEESEQHLELLSNTVPAMIFYLDPEERYRSYNKTFMEWFGIDSSAALGKTVREFIGDEAYKGVKPHLEKAYGGLQERYETAAPSKIEEGRWLSIVYTPHKDDKGKVLGIIVHATDITQSKQTEMILRESEARFRSLADQSPMIVYIVEPDEAATMSYFNKTWLDYTGLTLEQALGRAWDGIVHPDDLQGVFDIYIPAFQNRTSYVLPAIRLKRHDGEYRWHIFKGNPRYLPNGEFMGFIGVGFDIHEQKIADERIRESEQRFRTLAETLPQMVWIRNAEGTIEFASKNWEEYSGISNISEAWKAMTHPDDWTPVMNVWQKAVEAGTSFAYEVRLKNKEGEYRWHYAVGEPVKNETGNTVKYIGALTDIHIQKTFAEKLEKEVAESTAELKARNEDLQNVQSFLQQLIDSSVEYITVLDKDLRFVTVNKRYEDTMNISRQQLQGRHLFEVTPKAEGSLQHESILKALQGETVYLDKRQAIAKTGMYVDTYFIPLRTQNVIEGIIIMARDVTAIVQSENLLEQMNYELKRSNDDLQQFAHVASHDLKEPVRKVKTFIGRLEQHLDGKLDEVSLRYLEKVHTATNRMFSMIEGVLSYSTINSSSQVPERVDLNEVIRQIQTDLELVIQQKSATVQHEDLPELEGAPVLLYQLFYNLMNNSLKFAKEDTPPIVRISSSLSSDDNENYAQITFADNGIGFEQSQADKIFDTFTRLNSKDRYEGTGLGLALCKKIVERHGGTIEAISEMGEGATFIIRLPVKQAKPTI